MSVQEAPEASTGPELHGARKLPSGHEVTQISTSSSLYRSTQFHALLSSLLTDVLPRETAQTALDKFLHTLHPFLTTIPKFDGVSPLDGAKKLRKAKGGSNGVVVPWPRPEPAGGEQYKVSFDGLGPEDIFVAGSYAGKNKSIVRSREGTFVVDLVICMHAVCQNASSDKTADI
jgi:U3 small nucleolar RNA-associated protein 22